MKTRARDSRTVGIAPKIIPAARKMETTIPYATAQPIHIRAFMANPLFQKFFRFSGRNPSGGLICSKGKAVVNMEWEVVGVIVVLVGLIASSSGPMLKLNGTLTRLNTKMEHFTEGLEKFDRAYEEGLFDAVISTNLAYRIPELEERKWFVEADCSKYLAYIIAAGNLNEAVSNLLDPFDKIKELVASLEKKQQ